jgi:DNA-binding transcriptional regulator YbjK
VEELRTRDKRAAARRTAILEATLRVLGEQGPGGVTHRAVAAAADVPLAATTYYFASKEELLGDALRELAGREAALLEAAGDQLDLAGASARTIAEAITGVLCAQFAQPHAASSKFEVYLESARREDLSETTAHLIATFVSLAERVVGDRARAEVLVAGIDGLLIHELTRNRGRLDAARLSSQVELLISTLRAAAT